MQGVDPGAGAERAELGPRGRRTWGSLPLPSLPPVRPGDLSPFWGCCLSLPRCLHPANTQAHRRGAQGLGESDEFWARSSPVWMDGWMDG